MTPTSPLPQDVWDALPTEARTLFEAMRLRIEATKRQLDVLPEEVRSLRAQLQSHSRNSSRPPIHRPSPPQTPATPPPLGHEAARTTLHRRAIRPLVAAEQLADTVSHKLSACSGCGATLDGSDAEPIRHQVVKVPPTRPVVIEY